MALNLLLAAGIVAALAGGIVLLVRSSGDGDFTITLPTPAPTANSEVKVYVTGAVNVPGVYVVGAGASPLCTPLVCQVYQPVSVSAGGYWDQSLMWVQGEPCPKGFAPPHTP